MYRLTLMFSFLALATSLGVAMPSSSMRSRTRFRRSLLAFLAVGLNRSGAAMVAASDAAWPRVTNLTELFPK